MKHKITLIVGLCCLSGLLFAGGSTESKRPKQQERSREMYGYMVPASVPQRTAVGQIIILQMLDRLDVDIVARPSTKRKINERYKDKPEIGMPMRIDLEKLKEVNPDFYLATGTRGSPIAEQIKALNIPAEFLRTSTYMDILNSMKYLGEVYGRQEKAAAYVKEVEDAVVKIKVANQNKPPLKVLILFGAPGSMSIATPNYSFVGTLVNAIGVQNIWKDETMTNSFVPINLELIRSENPDAILVTTYAVDPVTAEKIFKNEFANEFWSKLDAVKNNRIYYLDFDYFTVAGSIHIKDSLEMLNTYLYGK